jgi:uncharacterized membrane protein
MPVELLVLRVVHVLGAIIWVGSGVMMAFFIAPALAGIGPAAGQVMANLQKRKFMIILPIVALLTILSGVRLMMITSSNFSAAYFATPMGKTFAWAGLAGILAFVFGIVVNRPIMVKMGKLQASVASDPASKEAIAAELKKLQQRAAMAGTFVMILLLLAAVGMATARYL